MRINRKFIQMPLNEFCERFAIGKCHPRKYLFVSFPIIARHWDRVHIVSAPRPVLPFFFKNEEIIPLGICYSKFSERLLRFNNFHLDFFLCTPREVSTSPRLVRAYMVARTRLVLIVSGFLLQAAKKEHRKIFVILAIGR